jgi:VWFA-related protein
LLAQQPNFTSRVSIVEVDAQVIGAGGTIEGLKLGDFAVRDNHKPVALTYCSQEATSLDVVFVFELSRFMGDQLVPMRAAAEAAMGELKEGDRVAVMSFNRTAKLELPLTSDLNAVKRQIRAGLLSAEFEKDPAILAAADASAKYFAGQKEGGHRVVLMFTGDVALKTPDIYSDVVTKDLWDANASLTAMVIPNKAARFLRFDGQDIIQLKKFLNISMTDFVEDVARDTGGQTVFTGDMPPRIHATPHPNAELRAVIQRMRRQYRLYYDRPPGKAGQHHKVEIELSATAKAAHPEARLIARKGYTVSKDEGQ